MTYEDYKNIARKRGATLDRECDGWYNRKPVCVYDRVHQQGIVYAAGGYLRCDYPADFENRLTELIKELEEQLK